jgi:hypothetical protein
MYWKNKRSQRAAAALEKAAFIVGADITEFLSVPGP